ncbi:MAG: hypothetical protein KC413_17045, partial [Anaerolineales bacterium]|nr:hypothetical protein [Anaerolineales bacterium]
MARKILFIRVFASVPIATSVEKMLRAAFPDYSVEVIDITQLIKRRQDIMLINSWHMLREYGWDMLTGYKKLPRAFLATPYLFHRVKKILTDYIEPRQETYAFTFQLQSLFDASTTFLPHFVYTDNTHLANEAYLDFHPRQFYPPVWLKLEQSIYQNAALIFTRSTNITRSLISQYDVPEEKIICAYAGANVPIKTRTDNGLLPAKRYDQRHILFVGINWKHK